MCVRARNIFPNGNPNVQDGKACKKDFQSLRDGKERENYLNSHNGYTQTYRFTDKLEQIIRQNELVLLLLLLLFSASTSSSLFSFSSCRALKQQKSSHKNETTHINSFHNFFFLL